MPISNSNKVSFLLGFATGAGVTHPKLRQAVKPAVRWAVRETVQLKAKLDKLAAYSSEELEDLLAEARAEARASKEEKPERPSSVSGATVEAEPGSDTKPHASTNGHA